MIKEFKNISIVYASASGNTLEVAKYIKDSLLDEEYDAELLRAEMTEGSRLDPKNLYIFAVSTWEHGVVNPHFNDLLEYFRNNKNELTVAFVGLGDLRYEPVLFCGGMNELKTAVISNGGQEIVSPLRINGDPHDQLETLVSNWLKTLITKLKE